MTILLVEDDPDIRSLIENYFSKDEDIHLHMVESGSDAVGQSLTNHFDLIQKHILHPNNSIALFFENQLKRL